MISIHVFSGTGNTLKCAQYLEEKLVFKEQQVSLNKIETGKEEIQGNPGTIIICYPVHGFNMPTNVLKFVKNMKPGNANVYFLKSSGEPLSANNNSSLSATRKLRKKGYKVLGEFHYIMPYNMIFRHTDEMAAYMWYCAQRKIDHDYKDIINCSEHKLKRTLSSNFMSTLCKIEHFGMRLNAVFIKVNKKKCVNCMACVKNCPLNNIKFKGNKIKVGTKCIGCTRCSFNCPTNAFRFGILNFMKVNGKYNFNADMSKAIVGKYCRKAYLKYFSEAESLPVEE